METLASARAGVKRPPNLRESVYQMLRERIQKGEIDLDEKLVDQDIASRLSISRMPVREALMQLKSEGALESTARGFVLRRFTARQMNEAFEVRRLVEPPAAVMACMRAKDAEVQGLKQLLDQADQAHAADDNAAFLRHKAGFRSAWMAMVPNQTLVDTIERFYDHVHLARLLAVADGAMRGQTLDYMRRMYEAFADGDADAARASVLAQLDGMAVRYNATL
ncbi:GntR family transcriptional regulator [Bordetella sp. LUAb4]|uniref:GntR family transcriptional regulator n=1 Tax=Bordetella sp. LUAb4 TaxID=2843195 RepID=UPI001E58DBAD|nr:GntR family transcriptional regulator [Bordetella sp. LUAb4]